MALRLQREARRKTQSWGSMPREVAASLLPLAGGRPARPAIRSSNSCKLGVLWNWTTGESAGVGLSWSLYYQSELADARLTISIRGRST